MRHGTSLTAVTAPVAPQTRTGSTSSRCLLRSTTAAPTAISTSPSNTVTSALTPRLSTYALVAEVTASISALPRSPSWPTRTLAACRSTGGTTDDDAGRAHSYPERQQQHPNRKTPAALVVLLIIP